MEMNGEFVIDANQDSVWAALNDPEVLKACLPGCEVMERTSDNSFEASMSAKIGPVKAKFQSEMTLEDVQAPVSYVITGQGKGGAAGFAKGRAQVTLNEVSEGTKLTYEVEMQVGGKLAQIGSRLVSGAARKIADQFFVRFADQFSNAEKCADE